MKETMPAEGMRFKPLWRIHNATYRRYAKGCTIKRIKRYITKIKKLMGMKR